MDDYNEINPPESPLAVPSFSVPLDWFQKDKVLYDAVFRWCKTRHPKVFVVVDKREDEELDEKDITYSWMLDRGPTRKVHFSFVNKDLLLEFCRAFPTMLRGHDDES